VYYFSPATPCFYLFDKTSRLEALVFSGKSHTQRSKAMNYRFVNLLDHDENSVPFTL
jgi:hypothetical protein